MADMLPIKGGGNGRGPDGRLLPGHHCQPTTAKRTPSLRERLKSYGDGDADADPEVETKSDKLVKNVWEDAIGENDASDRRCCSSRGMILERLAPTPKGELPADIIPADISIYAPQTINFLTELDQDTGGAPTTQDVLRKLETIPIDEMLGDLGKEPRDE